MTKEEADKYWELFYQGKKDAFDYANILIKREEYNNANSKFGWTIDYKDIKKISLNEKEQLLNTFPCSIIAKNIRQDKQHFHINGREFNFLMDNENKIKKLYEIKGKEKKCVDPHQRLEERIKDKNNEKIMEISGVKIKARQEINGDLVLAAEEEEQLLTALFSLSDYIDKFKSKIKDNKNIVVEIKEKLAKNYELPSTLFISTEKNKSEDILLLRELILNKNNTTFDFNDEEKTLYCYDENQTHKNEFIKKQLMLEDEIYYLTIKVKNNEGFLSLFFSEEYDDTSEDSAVELDAAFTFNLNKHDITKELKKEDIQKEEQIEQEEEIEEEEEFEEPEHEEVIESKFSHRFDTLLNINKEEIKKDLEKLNLEKTKREMKELEEKVAKEKEEKEKRRLEEEESKKLKDFIGQEKYETQIFKKEDLKKAINENDRTKTLVDEVAVSIAKEIKEKLEEKEKTLEINKEEINEEIEAPKEEILKEEKSEPEIKKKEVDPSTIKITAEFAKQAIENQEAITESLGDLDESEFEGIEPKEIDNQEENSEEQENEIEEKVEEIEEEKQEEKKVEQEQERDEEKEEEKKKKEEIIAKQLFRKIYGENVVYGKDFAGRTIKFNDYNKEDSDTGWNYILLTDTFGIELENVVLANIISLNDFNMNKKFVSNGQEFYVTKRENKYVLQSDEVLTNPFSYYDAKRLAYINRKKTKKLCYIFIKCTEIDGLNIKIENFNVFVDFVQRSIHKIVGTTLNNYEVGRDYIFITFDAEKEEAYKEAYYYSVLLNSYRKELKKDKVLNAVLVLSSIEVPISFLNRSCKDFIFDPEFKSIYEDLNKKLIDVTIKRAIHISPAVLNIINLDRNQLKKSRLIQDLETEEYYECNNVYLLNREEN